MIWHHTLPLTMWIQNACSWDSLNSHSQKCKNSSASHCDSSFQRSSIDHSRDYSAARVWFVSVFLSSAKKIIISRFIKYWFKWEYSVGELLVFLFFVKRKVRFLSWLQFWRGQYPVMNIVFELKALQWTQKELRKPGRCCMKIEVRWTTEQSIRRRETGLSSAQETNTNTFTVKTQDKCIFNPTVLCLRYWSSDLTVAMAISMHFHLVTAVIGLVC